MAVEIDWSDEAIKTFNHNIRYLQLEWSEKETAKFIQITGQVINRLKQFPEAYPPGNKSKNYRKARLNKYIVLFYHYNKTKNRITLLSFWNTKQNPDKLENQSL